MTRQNIVKAIMHKVNGNRSCRESDSLAVEEPLEIRLSYEQEGKRTQKSISITMRTPGDDFELAAGFLLGEGIVRSSTDIKSIYHSGAPLDGSAIRNTVCVSLAPWVKIEIGQLERHFYTTSSCGVCGKTSLEALELSACQDLPQGAPIFSAELIHRLPFMLRESQMVFEATGGLHAAALFSAEGKLLDAREDVGRHNAVDKLIGAQLLSDNLPLHDNLILVSGRASFELVQKALMAGAPVLAAVGAPSSLAVNLAGSFGMTLLGFVREERFNIYAGAWRIRESKIAPLDSRPSVQSVNVEVIR